MCIGFSGREQVPRTQRHKVLPDKGKTVATLQRSDAEPAPVFHS